MQKLVTFTRNDINYHVFRFNGNSESDAEVGTVKDVGVEEIIRSAIGQGANVVVNVTSGNYGLALKNAVTRHNSAVSEEQRIKVVHIVGPQQKKLDDLRGGLLLPYYFHGGILWSESPINFSIPFLFEDSRARWLTLEERTALAGEAIKRQGHRSFKIKGIVDVTHFVPHEYIKQAQEILNFMNDNQHLDYLAIPLGTGRVFISFYRALEYLRQKGTVVKTKLIGVVPEGENPVYNKFVRELGNPKKVYVIKNFDPKSKADKLSCPYTDLLPEIRVAISEGHLVKELDEDTIKNANVMAYNLGQAKLPEKNTLLLEDSASVGFALTDAKIAANLGLRNGSNVGIFVTGFGQYKTLPSCLESAVDAMRLR